MRDNSEIPLTADGPSYRVQRPSSSMDPNTRRLAIVAGGIGGALLLMVGIWSITGHHRGGIPVIEAASGPVRVKPLDPGGLEVFVGDDVVGQDVKAAMAPPPEAPNPQALRVQEKDLSPAATALPTTPAPSALAMASPATQPAAQRMTTDAAGTAAPNATLPPPLAAVPAPAAAAPATPAATPGASAAQVQLAALDSEQAAMKEWASLSRRWPDLFASHRPAVTRTEHDGRTYYRLRTGGFTDIAQATAFCQRVREKGAGCSLATF